MASYAPVTGGATATADFQAVDGQATITGWSVKESAGTPAVATIHIHDGTANTDPLVAVIELAASGSETVWFGDDGVYCKDGVFVDIAAGEATVIIYWR